MRARSTVGVGVLSAVALAFALPVSPAAASDDPIATPLAAQDVPGRDAAIEGLSARLTQLASPRLGAARAVSQADALDLPVSGPGSLQRQGDRLIVQARLDGSPDAIVPRLRDAGADILFVSDEYGTVDMAVATDDLRAVGATEGVASVGELLQPATNGAGSCGAVTTEADVQMRAAEARGMFGVDGSGVTVGILSDSFDLDKQADTHEKDDVKSGDLPGTDNKCGRKLDVKVLDEGLKSGLDEGRGMAQLVHDIAPGARLMFAGPGNSEEAMAANIEELRDEGADVIVDDLTFLAEPMYQDGAIANAVSDVTADGAVYFSSAANSNVIDNLGNEVGSFEAPAFRPMASCAGVSATSCMDFDSAPATTDNCLGFTMRPGSFTAVLEWAEPRSGVTTDLDLYAFDLSDGSQVGASQSGNISSGVPAELLQLENDTGAAHAYCFFIDRFAGAGTPRVKLVLGRAPINSIQYAPGANGDVFGPTIYGHNGAAAAMTTAAVPFDDDEAIEDFSSRGPVTLTHGPVNGTTPAAALGAPQVLNKPDIAATDGGQTTFFLPFSAGVFRFFGTSAAAPDAAGVAALEIQRNANATVAQLKSAQTSTADPVGAFPALAQGAGLVDAVGAVGNLSAGPDIAGACLDAQAAYDKELKKLAKLEKKKPTDKIKKKIKKQKKKVKSAKKAMDAACE